MINQSNNLAGAEGKEMPSPSHRSGKCILTEARHWVLLADVNGHGRLKFPSESATLRPMPDLIIYLMPAKIIIWWELTCPCEDMISAGHELKLVRYYMEFEVRTRE